MADIVKPANTGVIRRLMPCRFELRTKALGKIKMLSQPRNRPSPKYMMSVNSAFRVSRARIKRDEVWRTTSMRTPPNDLEEEL